MLIQSSLNGQNAKTIFMTTSTLCVFSLDLNLKLYWTERCDGDPIQSVNSLNITTFEETIIVRNSNVDSFIGVAVFGNTVYWTGHGRVYKTSLSGDSELIQIVYTNATDQGTIYGGMVVVHPSRQPDPRNSTPTEINNSNVRCYYFTINIMS